MKIVCLPLDALWIDPMSGEDMTDKLLPGEEAPALIWLIRRSKPTYASIEGTPGVLDVLLTVPDDDIAREFVSRMRQVGAHLKETGGTPCPSRHSDA